MSNFKYNIGQEFYHKDMKNHIIRIVSYHDNKVDYICKNITGIQYGIQTGQTIMIYYTRLETEYKPTIENKINFLLKHIR